MNQQFVTSELGQTVVENIASICHEANRAFCTTLGDLSHKPWSEAPEWQKDSARKGVELHLAGDHGPEASHESWMKQKVADGWVYGEKKDEAAKTHPCLVPFSQLDENQQMKDKLFISIVHAFKKEILG